MLSVESLELNTLSHSSRTSRLPPFHWRVSSSYLAFTQCSKPWNPCQDHGKSWLAFAQSCMAMVSLPKSWQDLGKASKELAMDLGKGTMASNTGQCTFLWRSQFDAERKKVKCLTVARWFLLSSLVFDGH